MSNEVSKTSAESGDVVFESHKHDIDYGGSSTGIPDIQKEVYGLLSNYLGDKDQKFLGDKFRVRREGTKIFLDSLCQESAFSVRAASETWETVTIHNLRTLVIYLIKIIIEDQSPSHPIS